MNEESPSIQDVLLRRQGLVFLEDTGRAPALAAERAVAGVVLALGGLGYVMSHRLQQRLAGHDVETIGAVGERAWRVLAEHKGATQKHEPLFRSFPAGIPDDTRGLYWQRVLVHFFQAKDQPCLTCDSRGSTHVLNPCRHVVCDVCFDGASYSGCPICHQHVDRGTPFFQASPALAVPLEQVRFARLDVPDGAPDDGEVGRSGGGTGGTGGSNAVDALDRRARDLLLSFCARKQVMSPVDVADLKVLVRRAGLRVLSWLPESIPVKENVAHVFGTLFVSVDPARVLPAAQLHLKTATDVLRFLAALSGADPGLVPTPRYQFLTDANRARFPLKKGQPALGHTQVCQQVRRFKVAKLSRPLRRTLLGLLDAFAPDALVEDMLRHRGAWVGVGERLHPHEHVQRFPNVCAAFAVVREHLPDGSDAPPAATWMQRFHGAVDTDDVDAMLQALDERPGELARRLDHALRVAAGRTAAGRPDPAAARRVVDLVVKHRARFATPVLVTLRGVLPTRVSDADGAPAARRVFWPKGTLARAVVQSDRRPPLSSDVVAPLVRLLDDELLARFGDKPAFDDAIVDRALQSVIAPSNERGAGRSAVALPRGSRLPVAPSKTARLFLHWCQPERGERTDIDLSVAFFDARWFYQGVCSYYQLKHVASSGKTIATSSGDRTSAPFPDGASEFVDIDRAAARAAGHRYAVMVVNAYAGLSFSLLERGFAGVMLRDDVSGQHFDPRTVELKFDLQGDNGVFMPLVFDLEHNELFWMDLSRAGQFAMNNVATSKDDIGTLCPAVMSWFNSGVRLSVYEIALLHAAARCRRVWLRGDHGAVALLERAAGETSLAFLQRLRASTPTPTPTTLATTATTTNEPLPTGPLPTGPLFGALLHGDIDVKDGGAGSQVYALFRERLTSTISASDLSS